MMNTMQVRREALDIMNKLNGSCQRLSSPLAFQNGESISLYPFLCLTGPSGSGKSYIPFLSFTVA